MTPHAVQEGMAELYGPCIGNPEHEKFFWDTFDKEIWKSAWHHLKNAVHFDFGATVPEKAHIEFGSELHDHGLLKLPYKSVFISGGRLQHAGLLVFEDWINEAVDKLTVITCGEGLSKDSKIEAMPLMASWFEPDKAEEWHWATATHHGRFGSRDGKRLKHEDIEETSARSISALYGALGFLSSKDAEVERVPAPTKLNARRVKRGRVPIGEKWTIKIKHTSLVREGYTFDGRSSPRTHWRRGHLRKLQNGTIIPISPMLINASEEAREIIYPKRYKVV